MKTKPKRPRRRTKWAAAERVAQINVVLLLCQGTLVRLVYGWEEGIKFGTSRPPLTQFLFFLFVAAIGIIAMVACAVHVERFPRRWQRIAATIGTLVFQFIMFQVFIAWLNR